MTNERAVTPGDDRQSYEQEAALYLVFAESLSKPDAAIEKAWLYEAEDRLAAYGRGEIASVTLDKMIAARKGR